jgi:hypothetical protein
MLRTPIADPLDNRCVAELPDGRVCGDAAYAPLPELCGPVCARHYPARTYILRAFASQKRMGRRPDRVTAGGS